MSSTHYLPSAIHQKARVWAREHYYPQTDTDKVDFTMVHDQIEHLARTLFDQYEPTKGAGHACFGDRLAAWLDNAPDDTDQQVLFRLVPHLLFIDQGGFDSLYQAAFNGHVARWLIDQLGLRLDDPRIGDKLHGAVKQTWFCPITDSMQIAKFYHLNNIEGVDLRPDWRTLRKFGDDAQKIVNYMRQESLLRMVLLEDFVGTGDQIENAVRFAAGLPGPVPVLVCPIVVCPGGIKSGRQLATEYPNICFDPVMELLPKMFVTDTPSEGEPNLFTLVRNVAHRFSEVIPVDSSQDYGPFGYRGTGGLVVMYSNCPNNTLPIVHHDSKTWHALFPRSSRV